ncbi:PspC domain-containing protein [Vallitalea maricola]|uniref:PspC domain-containing protein n=1 Tax=Vallitalea maricola TaxID=3074433 RepID=A0ACB5UEK2_9FIRM|nr:PspC domain-containing protein [Vallitalea sp. AN17-2]
MKRLVKSRRNRKINGVCGGIAEYLDVDPTIIRLLFTIGIIFGGAGLWAYIICVFVIPDE